MIIISSRTFSIAARQSCAIPRQHLRLDWTILNTRNAMHPRPSNVKRPAVPSVHCYGLLIGRTCSSERTIVAGPEAAGLGDRPEWDLSELKSGAR